MKTMSKSQKRPERMFGGNLCSKCSKREIIKRNRK
jgi:ribosomal protein L34E